MTALETYSSGNSVARTLITADITSCRKRKGGLVSSLSLSGGFFTILPRLFCVFLMVCLRLAMVALGGLGG